MRIYVTQEDIDKGTMCQVSHCPIALAFKRRGVAGAQVGVDHIYDSATYRNWSVPERATKFIVRFDIGQIVKPTWFDFEPLE